MDYSAVVCSVWPALYAECCVSGNAFVCYAAGALCDTPEVDDTVVCCMFPQISDIKTRHADTSIVMKGDSAAT